MNKQDDIDFEKLFKQNRLPVIAHLMSKFRNLELVEDSYQEAVILAFELWQKNQHPQNMKAWLIKVASNKILDQLRRIQNFSTKQTEITFHTENIYQENLSLNRDNFGKNKFMPSPHFDLEQQEIINQLKMMFLCCHPALKKDAQIALSLNVIGGLKVEEIAKAFLLPKATMAKRLTRAKQKIKLSNIPFKMPEEDQIEHRLNEILNVIYLIHNEAYQSTSKAQILDKTLCNKALDLIKILNELKPKSPNILGLYALILLQLSRFSSRINKDGYLIILEEQDRKLWDQDLIEEGKNLVLQALSLGQLCKYQIMAAINAIHCEAKTYQDTDFLQIKLLYQKLYELEPSSTILLNLYAASLNVTTKKAELLQMLNQLKALEERLANYVPYHLLLAELFQKLENKKMANQHMQLAIDKSDNPLEVEYFKSKLQD